MCRLLKAAYIAKEPHIVDCDLHQCLPDYVSSVLERALPYWGRRIKGFDNPEISMTGVETRTSSTSYGS